MSMQFRYYDIESLDNVFTCACWRPEEKLLDLYVLYTEDQDIYDESGNLSKRNIVNLLDPSNTAQDKIKAAVIAGNPTTFTNNYRIRLIDLATPEGCKDFAKQFGYYPNSDRATITMTIDFGDGSEPQDATACKLASDIQIKRSGVDDSKYYYLLGYNSYNYDTCMLALFFHEAYLVNESEQLATFHIPSAKILRSYNDTMFGHTFNRQMTEYLLYPPDDFPDRLPNRNDPTTGDTRRKWDNPRNIIRRNFIMSGRYIDVARLNEKQAHVGLKRLLGMLGCQILESDKLDVGVDHINDFDELCELLAYNASDVLNLETLFNHQLYKSQFELKREMLTTYEDSLVLTEKKDRTGHVVRDEKTKKPVMIVRKNRLYADSSSQQFASRALCPDNALSDKMFVSFIYPDESKCASDGSGPAKPYDVLESSLDFFTDKVLPRIPAEDKRDAALAAFKNIYNYYASIRNNSFNKGEKYKYDYNNRGEGGTITNDEGAQPQTIDIKALSEIPRLPNNIQYYGKDGEPTSCYVTFSTGGIHGAELNLALYHKDLADYERTVELIEFAKQECDRVAKEYREYKEPDKDGTNNNGFIMTRATSPYKNPVPIQFCADGKTHYLKEFFRGSFTKTHAQWRTPEKPELFKACANGSTTPNPAYAWTSVAEVNHEDFTSYYPNLLRMMNVFENPHLNYDRYGEIFEGKQRYDKERKDPTKTDKERAIANLKRDGVKLILNTASGAGDAKFDNPVRMNNNVIAMRIIGQLFSWRIGQAQALHGARVISTNTDGLYTVLDEEENNHILDEQSKLIHVDIEPERLYLISKDSNNRIEYKIIDGIPQILSASGGTLAAYNGPDPAKSLAHPAMVDLLLVRYLIHKAGVCDQQGQDNIAKPFDFDAARTLMAEIIESKTTTELLLYFQNVVASNPSSHTYLFGSHTPITGESPLDTTNVVILQRYNRVFVMKDNFDPTTLGDNAQVLHLQQAQGRIITTATQATRKRSGNPMPYQDDPIAQYVLEAAGEDIESLHRPTDTTESPREAIVKRMPGLDPAWNMLVENHDITRMDPARQRLILNSIDQEAYICMAAESYEENWRNHVPEN